MHMTGAMAKGLEESRHFWIVERQSVPGFLAQVTTEMFEKTTVSCWDIRTVELMSFRLGGLRDTSVSSDTSRNADITMHDATSSYISPHSVIRTTSFGLLRDVRSSLKDIVTTDLFIAPVGTFSTFRTVKSPSTTRPNTQCFPSRNSAGAQVMKNYDSSPSVSHSRLQIKGLLWKLCNA